jgi:hypothetical protein
MPELSHSDQILKQLKIQWSNSQKFNDDISMTSPSYLHYDNVAEASGNMWHADWKVWQAWTNTVLTRGMQLI